MARLMEADAKVARFRAEVLPPLVARYRPSKVLVFGSRARGEAHAHSDVDVLIVSSAFRDIPWLDRRGRIRQDCDIPADIELLCYTPEEYERKVDELGIVRTATVEGVDLLGGPPMRVAEPRPPSPERVQAWFTQAQHDFAQAEDSRKAGRHDWACVAAQQAAEKAVKGLLLRLGREARGHVLELIFAQFPAEVAVPQAFVGYARALDRCYLAPRYPNAHDEGAPFEHYGPAESERAIHYAREILAFARARIA